MTSPVFDSHSPSVSRMMWLGMFLTMFGAYLVTSGGHIYVKDGGAMYFMSCSMLDRGWFDVEINANTLGGRTGADGKYYTPFGFMQPLLAVPFIAFGRMLIPWAQAYYIPAMTATWFNAMVTAALITLMARFFLDLKAPLHRAIWAGVAIGFSSPFWVYSRTFFSEPLATLGTLASAWELHQYHRSTKVRHLIRSGLWISGVLLVRPLSGVALPVLFLYLALIENESVKQGLKSVTAKPFMIFGLMLVLGVGLLLTYNVVRFGSILETGYDLLPNGKPRNFTLEPTIGLSVLLLAPGKSIFIFTPLVIAAIAGLFLWRRRIALQPEFHLIWLTPVMFIVVLCRWAEVEGGVTWGPRLAMPGIPILLLALAPLLRGGKWTVGFLVLLTIIGIGVQMTGITVNFSAYIADHVRDYFGSTDGENRHYRFDFNPFPGHLALLRDYIRALPTIEPLSEDVARSHRSLVQINYHGQLDFWWLHLWRDRIPMRFILTFVWIQLGLLFTGIFIMAKEFRRYRQGNG